MRTLRTAVVLVLASSALTGCNVVTTSTCVDYIGYENPAAMAEAAALVVVGTQRPTEKTAELSGARLPVFEVTVETVLKGNEPGAVIEVVSPPADCFVAGSTVDSALLGSSERTEFFLREFDGRWLTLSPMQGAEPALPGSPLPWDPSSAAE
jgi:hypothetical protein